MTPKTRTENVNQWHPKRKPMTPKTSTKNVNLESSKPNLKSEQNWGVIETMARTTVKEKAKRTWFSEGE